MEVDPTYMLGVPTHALGQDFLVGEGIEMFWNSIVIRVPYPKQSEDHWITFFKMMNFVVCEA